MSDKPRTLSDQEVVFLRGAFGSRIAFERVRLFRGPSKNPVAMAAFRNGNTAITLRQSIYFRSHYCDDFCRGGVQDMALLAHELTHVWQYSRLGVARFLARYAREFASVRFTARDMYRYEAGVTTFWDARLEAQAQMVGDYQFARLTGDAPRQAQLARNLRGSGFFGL